ncbi:MAG: hypothetical protein Kow0098_04620 [Ignavibacteriaceae bacterium]
MKSLLEILAILILIFLNDCNTTDPPPPPQNGEEPTLELTVEDVSCTEAWITLTTNNLQLPTTVTLYKDTVGQTISLSTADTVIYVDSLMPNQTYTFHTTIQSSSYASNEITVTTMDTTSHDFTFETYTFGGTAGSSALYDVAIIDENNIWAVGEIYVADTSQNGYTMYNAVHWDGSEWELERITVSYNGNLISPPLYGIFAFSETEIWLSSGVPMKGDGNNWTQYHLFDMGILNQSDGYLTKIWGSSSSDLYFVGTLGTIAHYNGQSWQRIESGTELNINDIWGDYNEKTGEWEILAVASNILQSFEKQIIKINNTGTEILNKDGVDETLSSVWFKPNRKYYVAGSGIYKKHIIYDHAWEGAPLDITHYFIYKLRGANINDVAATGGFGEMLHFNGYSWRSFIEDTQLTSGNYYGIDIRDNTIVAVGINNPQAVITIGKRIN